MADYIRRYVAELSAVEFEPEREFETLVEYEDDSGSALIGGAIIAIGDGQAPRVSLVLLQML